MSRLIKRYENRKLYDVGEKRYVSLEEIADRIRCGADVTVIENATGSDITAQTLAKLFAEDRNALQHPMAAELLHHLVRLSGSVVAGGVEQLLQGVDRAIEVAI